MTPEEQVQAQVDAWNKRNGPNTQVIHWIAFNACVDGAWAECHHHHHTTTRSRAFVRDERAAIYINGIQLHVPLDELGVADPGTEAAHRKAHHSE